MKKRIFSLLLIMITICFNMELVLSQTPKNISILSTQQPQQPQQEQQPKTEEEDLNIDPIKIGGEIVLLNVLVRDIKNRHALNVVKNEFELYEDGKKQEISFFSKQNEPVSLCILIDASTSMIENGKLLEALKAAKALFSKSNPKDEISIMKFDDRTTLIQDFTSNNSLLNEQIERIKPFGGTAMYDALARAMSHTNKNAKKLRQAIVMISDGIDQHSHKSFNEVISIAQLTGIPCYIIGVYTAEERQIFASGQQKLKLDTGGLVDNPELVLRNLAEETAGQAFFPSSERELVTIATQIADELRNGYALGYYPPSTSLDGKYHTISVVSKSKKYVVRARRGYISKLPE